MLSTSTGGRLGGALLLAVVLTGCSGPGEPAGSEPLLADGLAPDVLTEAPSLELPPSRSGNRFLAGWWPGADRELPTLVPQPSGARLEVVSLSPRPRSLHLDLEPLDGAEATVRVAVAGREVGRFPVTDPLEIPLPADLDPGRTPIDLHFAGLGTKGVVATEVRPALPAGEVRIEDGEVTQSGASRVDVVRRLDVDAGTPRAVITGRFEPPRRPTPGQRFRLEVEDESGRVTIGFSWRPGWLDLLGISRRFEVPFDAEPAAGGFVRLRLVAEGTGPPGRWRDLRWHRAVPSPEPAAPTNAVDAEPPSLVVVYVMDALRADFVGHLGGPEGVSPTLDRLAAEGMTFRDHHSVAPNTLPSTRALFTGRTVKHYRDNGRMPADGPPTLAERFQAAGYRTGLFSGNTYAGPKFRTDRGFDHVGRGLWIDPDSGFNDNAALVQRAALEWLSSLPPGEKAFLYLHTLHPHNPYDPPPAMAAEWSRGIPSDLDGSTSTLRRIRRRQLDTSPADRDRLRALYAASLRYNDQILGPFLERLVQLRDAAETVAVLTSDHGEELFDHGGILHGYTLYDEATRIPLILWGPGRIPAAAVDAPTSTLDLHPTLTALCRLPPADPEKGARDLLELAAGADDAAVGRLLFAAAPSVRGGIYSARGRRWKAVRAPRMAMRWGMGYRLGRSWDVEYLFDLRADPGETVNRAGHGDLEAAWARSRLLAWIDREVHLGTADGEPPELDAETREQLRALGYL